MAQSADFSKKVGSTIHAIELIKALARLKNKLIVVTREITDEKCKYLIDSRKIKFVNIKFLNQDHPLYYVGLFLGYLHTFVKSLSIAIIYKVDLIYERDNLGLNVGPIIGLVTRKKTVLEVNGVLEEIKKDKKLSKIIYILVKVMGFITYHLSYRIRSVTKGLKEYLIYNYKLPSQKIFVVSNGVNTELFKPNNKLISRKALNLPISYNYVCFVGNFSFWQGLETLIRSSIDVVKEIPNLKYIIIGDGVLKEKLINLACQLGVQSYVIFTGSVEHEKVPNFINASTVCVAPFTRERNFMIGVSPLKVYEYLSCGVPVIASNVPGVELLSTEKCGLLVNPDDPVHLSKATIFLLKNRRLARKMGLNGRKMMVKKYSWENVAWQILEKIKN